jgi:adenosylhomocysteinase
MPAPAIRSPIAACSCGRASCTRSASTSVARLHLDALAVRLTTLSEEQAAYIGVPVDGPSPTYRY